MHLEIAILISVEDWPRINKATIMSDADYLFALNLQNQLNAESDQSYTAADASNVRSWKW